MSFASTIVSVVLRPGIERQVSDSSTTRGLRRRGKSLAPPPREVSSSSPDAGPPTPLPPLASPDVGPASHQPRAGAPPVQIGRQASSSSWSAAYPRRSSALAPSLSQSPTLACTFDVVADHPQGPCCSHGAWRAPVWVLSREVENVAVIVRHSLLGKLQLPLHLRGDKQDISGYKKRGYWETAGEEKVTHFP